MFLMNVPKVDMQNSLALQAILHVFDTERRVKLLKKKKSSNIQTAQSTHANNLQVCRC